MSINIIRNGEYLPHQSIVLVNRKNLSDFKLDKILKVYKNRKRENLTLPIWELEVHPIDFCKLACKGCSYSKRHSNFQIDFESLINAIKHYSRFDLRTVFFSGGGDPALWKEWEHFVEITKNRAWKIGISTNLYDISHIRNVINDISHYQIHVIGHNRESVLKECGVDTYDILRKHHQILFNNRHSDQTITMKVLVRNETYLQLDLILDYINNFNPDIVVIKLEQDFLNNRIASTGIALNKVRDTVLTHLISDRFDYCLDNLDDITFNNPKPTSCYIVNMGVYALVRADGCIYPCVAGTFNKDYSYNNIRSLNECSNKIADSTYYNKMMIHGICPLHACRHYRFNSIIEKYCKQDYDFDLFNQDPTLL